jgi:hypothetical protein
MPAEAILKQLPFVVSVETKTRPAKSARRIVHFADYHFIPAGDFAADFNTTLPGLTVKEVATLYRKFLLEVEVVQEEQLAGLKALVKHHGFSRIVLEGLTPNKTERFDAMVIALKTVETEELPRLRKELDEARRFLGQGQARSKPDRDRHQQANKVQRRLQELTEKHRPELLQLGVAGRLKLAGPVDVLPLDDPGHFEATGFIFPKGTVRIDPAALKVRHASQVKRLAAYGAFSLVVLGAAHDLTADSDDGATEYVWVTTRAVSERMKE